MRVSPCHMDGAKGISRRRVFAATLPPIVAWAAGHPVASRAATPVSDSTVVTHSGKRVTWGAPWQLDQSNDTSYPDYDFVFLWHDATALVIGDGNPATAWSRDSIIENLVGIDDVELLRIVDQWTAGPAWYSLDLYAFNGWEYVSLAMTESPEMDGTETIVILLTPLADYPADLDAAQAGIAIDGMPALSGVDPNDIATRLAAASTPAAVSPESTPGAYVPAMSWTDAAYGYTVTWAKGWFSTPLSDGTYLVLKRDDELVFAYIQAVAWDDEMPVRLDDFITVAETFEPLVEDDRVLSVSVTTDGIVVVNEVFALEARGAIVLTRFRLPKVQADEVIADYRASVRIEGRAPLAGLETIYTPPS